MNSLSSYLYILDGVAFDLSFIFLLLGLIQGNPKTWHYFGAFSVLLLIYSLFFDTPSLEYNLSNPFFIQRFFNVGLAWYGMRFGKQIQASNTAHLNDNLLDAGDILHTPRTDTPVVVYSFVRKYIAHHESVFYVGAVATVLLLVVGIRNYTAIDYLPLSAGNILQVMLTSFGLVLLANRIVQGCAAFMLSWGVSLLLFAYMTIQFDYEFDAMTIFYILPNIIIFWQALHLQKQWLRLPLVQ